MLVTGETLGPSDRKRIIGLPHSVFTSLHFIHTPYCVFQKYRPNPQSHCGRHTEDHLFFRGFVGQLCAPLCAEVRCHHNASVTCSLQLK